MTEIKKIKRAALITFCAMSVSLLLHLAHVIYVRWLFVAVSFFVDWNPLAVAATFIPTIDCICLTGSFFGFAVYNPKRGNAVPTQKCQTAQSNCRDAHLA